ncbi:MAG: S-layer homology domain-containing protein, partial [Oscillospiraceae bacterium]|nr:S-layer homology domain-containing protein [Oscillospiraceae bacterium]
MKKLVSTILALALVISFAPAATLSFAAGTPSGWAVGEMNEANLEGLLTPNAQKDFQRVLTRTEFCELVVALIERTLGSELPLPASNPFTDTSNIDVQKASLYGGSSPVVEGVGGGLFSPNNNVSREQIVTMMIRALDRLSIDTERALLPAQPAASLPFKDNSNISAWAADSLKKAYANNIIKGNDLGNFNPRAHIKSEECVAIVRRSNSTSQEILNAGLSPTQLAEKTERDINIGFAYGDTEQGVSQNILLPTSGAGGAAISWQSSNPDVIAISGSTGIVKTAGMTAQTTLIATINASGVTRTKQFVLHTTPYAGDERIMQNALQALELEYLNSGDTADSVTGRVFLPDSSLGARVTWSSSAPSVVNASTGAVTLPSDSSTVTLTATVSYNSLTRTKAFTLT